jgi:hypothetical protein
MTRLHLDNDKFSIAYGVDHVFGSFFQIYRRHPAVIEQDIPVVDADNRGIRLAWSEDDPEEPTIEDIIARNDKIAELLGPLCWGEILALEKRFSIALKGGNHAPNMSPQDIIEVIRPLGFTSDEEHRQIYKALD